MFDKILDQGVDGKVTIGNIRSKNSQCVINSKKRHVIIEDNCSFLNSNIFLEGENIHLIIRRGVRFCGNITIKGDNSYLSIGEHSTFERCNIVALGGKRISIGKDCMISYDVEIRNTDAHPIYSLDGLRLNDDKDSTIGDHVWISAHTSILKGVQICDNIIIGTRSVVNKNCNTPYSIYAGVPAVLKKYGVKWERK